MIGFAAHKNYADQSGWTPNCYNLVTWPAISYNEGGRFDGRWFVPVHTGESNALVIFSGQIWLQAGAPPNNVSYVAKLFKNGVGLRAPIMSVGSFTDTGPISMSIQDRAAPGDSYDWQFYTAYANTVINGDPAHTWFSALVVPTS